MSGHSKWANIRVKKTAQDARRGKVFTRHARLIEIAARGGGEDPQSNSLLRTAMENAREDNVPSANIERAIKKGTGELKGEQMQEITYEAYGPGGTAYIVECLTNNRNRTAATVRSIVSRHCGHMAEGGAVSWMFERKGLVLAEMHAPLREETILALIDAGAEDIAEAEGVLRITTALTGWTAVRDLLKKEGWTILSAGLSSIPKQKVDVQDPETAKKIADFLEALENDDDVSQVHTNAEIVLAAE